MNNTTHRIIWNYAKMNSWLGHADLLQEAHVASLEAGKTWSKGGGANVETYTNRAIALRLRLYTLKQRSPVSAGASNIERKLDGVLYVDLDSGTESSVCFISKVPVARDRAINRSVLLRLLEHDAAIECRLDMARASAAIRRLIDSHPDGWLAKDVLLGERKPGEVAREMGINRRDISRAVRSVKQSLAQAPELQAYAEL